MGEYRYDGYDIKILIIEHDPTLRYTVFSAVNGVQTFIYYDPVHIPGNREAVMNALIEEYERGKMARLGIGYACNPENF